MKLLPLLLLLALPAAVKAQFTFTTNNGALTITRYTGPGGAVTIPDTTNGYPITSIGDDAFFSSPNLTSVTIGNNVTNIGIWAFNYCTSLTNITIGNSVASIGYEAFKNCSMLTSVTIPNSVTSIGDSAFDSCSSLTNVNIGNGLTNIGFGAFAFLASLTAITVDALNSSYSSVDGVLFNKSQTTLIQWPGGKGGSYAVPNTVTSIGIWAFNYCTSLTNVTIGNSVTSIGNDAFEHCNYLTSVTIPNSVVTIGANAFAICLSLNNVNIGNGVTNIGSAAFASCYCLTSVTIPNSVTSIGDGPFANCIRLTAITVGALNSSYSSVDGVLFNKSQTTLVECPGGKAGSYAVPNSVTTIGDAAFQNCTSLANITIGNSVTSIGYQAFWNCSRLTSVTIPNSVTSIGHLAFSIPSLTAITVDTLNSSYSSVDGVLFNKSQTTLIQWPGGKGGSYSVPNTVTSIGDYAFAGFTKVTGVTLGNAVTNIGNFTFNGCTSLTSVTIPNSVTSIGDYVFSDCTSLTNVTILNSVTTVGDAAFEGCSSLASVTIGNSVTSIGDDAFSGCASAGRVTIPGSVTNIGDYAFWYCTRLTGVYFQGNAPSLGDYGVFYSDNNATVYYLPGITGWNPQVQTSGAGFGVRTNRFGFNITGNSNLVIVVQACTNLANPIWASVATNTLTGGSSYFSDPQWTNYTCRFYRLWGLTFAGLPAVLWNPQFQVNDSSFGVRTNKFGFTITGTTDIPIMLEACTNLTSPVWVPLQSCTLTNGSVYFSDPDWTNYPARFYRLRSP
ncbi:MAG: leucine-rich repeat domain-containing protein [Verrucomicrobiota bacterium]